MAVRKEEVRVTADVSNFITRFSAASRAADGFANRLEAADGRLAGVVQSALALAPALAPIGAAAVPAIAGLATQLGLAGLAAGATALAFQGVGDAVKALDTFKTTPTAENFAKLQIAMDKLGPAGQEFVLSLQKIRPEIQRLQSISQQGLFPGVTAGMNELLAIMPQVEDVLFTTSKTLGNLTHEGAKNLAGPEFEQFFTYLQTTAGPVLTEMGRTFGNFIEGTANLVQAFDPLSRDFSTGLLDVSRSFAEFTANLDSTEGFRDFLNYVEKSGPLALDALESVGNALVQLIEAAAPVGTAVLPIISALADGLAAVADSPVGPALISAAAAVGILGRSLALLKIVGLRGGDGVVAQSLGAGKLKGIKAAMQEVTAATDALRVAEEQRAQVAMRTKDAQFALIPEASKRSAISDYVSAQTRVTQATERVTAAEQKRTTAFREAGVQAGKAGLAIGGLALATSGLADSTGLANTASLGLMGTIAGPYGVAVGVGVGAVMDLAAANNSLVDAVQAADRSMSSANVGDRLQSLDGLRQQTDEYRKSVHDAWTPGGGTGSVVGDFKQGWTAIGDIFTNAGEESDRTLTKLTADQNALRQSLAELYANTNGGDLSLVNAPLDELAGYAEKVAPALSAAGLSFDDLAKKPQAAAAAVSDYDRAQRESVTDSGAVADAMDYLSGTVVPKLTQATDLNSDGLVNNTDKVLANIDAMKKRTDATVAAFDAETAYQAALDEGNDRDKEKAAIQQQIADAQAAGNKQRADLRARLAGAKTPSERASIRGQISDSFDNQAKQVKALRERLDEYRNTLDATTAAGRKNRGILSDMAKGFNGLSDAEKNAKGKYKEARDALIKQAEQFGANRKQAKHFADTLLQIPPRVQAKIILDEQRAAAKLKRFSDAFDGLNGKTAKAFIELQQKHNAGDPRLQKGFAEGGYTGPGGRLEPAGIVHRGEFVIDAIQTKRHRSLLEAIHRGSRVLPGYSGGGYVGAAGLSSGDLDRIVSALSSMRPVVGTQIVQPHNYNEFRRQQDSNERLTSMGAVSFRG